VLGAVKDALRAPLRGGLAAIPDRSCAPRRPGGVGTRDVPSTIDQTPPAQVEQGTLRRGLAVERSLLLGPCPRA